MEPRYDGNGRRQYQHIDRVIRRTLRARRNGCGICHGALGPIDYSGDNQYSPLTFEVDHVIAISLGGKKTLENSRAVHRICNQKRGNRIDGDAIAAGAETNTSTHMAKASKPTGKCPPGPCEQCHGIHNPQPRVMFVTTRSWSP